MSTPVHVLPVKVTADRILKLLQTCSHNGFPVVSDQRPVSTKVLLYWRNFPAIKKNKIKYCTFSVYQLLQEENFQEFGKLEGFITRDQLIVILAKKVHTVNCSYTGLQLGQRFRVRYTRNPVYPNEIRYIPIPDCTKYTVSCFCGTEILGPVCGNSGITESGIRMIDCTYCLANSF